MKQTTMGSWHSKYPSSSGSKMDFSSTGDYFKNISKKDTEDYRKGYPGKIEHPDWDNNLQFYRNELESTPDGGLIDKIHDDWFEDYKRLERHHGYIQWLFPIRESGMNWSAQELQLHEAEAIQKDPKAQKRVLKSYKLMLNFYGMILSDEETGEIERARNWKSRFEHLNHSFHNYLRISRMMKSLGELGYEHLKKPFLMFILKEALLEGTLYNTTESCSNYWIETLRSDKERKGVRRNMYIMQHTKEQPQDEGSDIELATSRSNIDDLTQEYDVTLETGKLDVATALSDTRGDNYTENISSGTPPTDDDNNTHSHSNGNENHPSKKNGLHRETDTPTLEKVPLKDEEMEQVEETGQFTTKENCPDKKNDLQRENPDLTSDKISEKNEEMEPVEHTAEIPRDDIKFV